MIFLVAYNRLVKQGEAKNPRNTEGMIKDNKSYLLSWNFSTSAVNGEHTWCKSNMKKKRKKKKHTHKHEAIQAQTKNTPWKENLMIFQTESC